ncbi:hypothetical protein HG537_0G03430 [Torulaspora globosa]|uniref:SWR1-complex protein 5 n=1 Tax=Torulaspora globosa TaxID=48254 RepID=A0A7H9HWJ7_9SACH|nr:hypothetical protein HG537_0G03430 [Torulaspora sp. CBS 2947]
MAVQLDGPQEGQDVFQEELYKEEEDEDFKPGSGRQSEQEDEDEEDDYREESDSVRKQKDSYDYSHIESESGGLIRTRRGRQLEEELKEKRKYEGLQAGTVSESVQDVWEELKRLTDRKLKDRTFCRSVLADGGDIGQERQQEEQILIKRDYKFAGEVVHEEKMVPISSVEAQEYLKSKNAKKVKESVKFEINEQSQSHGGERDHGRLRRPLKRPPYLEQIIAGSLKPKLTTLEKSSLDWTAYVNKEGLTDELTLYNKDGYLAKQDFLNRVEMVKEDKYRELRQKQLAAQLQEQQ